MFPLVLGQIRTLLALAALGATSFTRPAAASAQDEWRPRTVPLLGASYSPDLGLLIGVGVAHTRYGFRALPPSTRLLASAEFATGAGSYGQVGTRAELELDTRDMPVAPARGAHLQVAAEWYPAAWDVGDSFGSVSAEASTYASAGDPPAATLALRVGGAAASGTVPFSELVHVGGEATVRGYAEQRFAGRTGAYANAELRLRLGWLSIGDYGVFGLADAGRVWVADEASDRW